MTIRPPHIGFPVQILGRPGLKSHDARRWQSNPHLRVSLEHLRQVFAYLDEVDIRMYRMASGLAPYGTHPDHPEFHGQVEECSDELAELGATARRLGLRLSFHPSQYIVLNAPDDDLAARPKVHFSSPRTDWGFGHGSEGEPRAPNWTAHAEFADPFAFIEFYRPLADAAPDVVLEAKAKDIAVAQLRRDLVRYAPDLAAAFDLAE